MALGGHHRRDIAFGIGDILRVLFVHCRVNLDCYPHP
jgi:hypothetical protein